MTPNTTESSEEELAARAEELAAKIDDTRITYPEREYGVGIEGSPFTIEFDDAVDPEEWIDTITTPEDPWRMFGVAHGIDPDNDYYGVAGVLFEVNKDDERVGATKVDIEVAPEFARCYVKGEEADADRVAEFTMTVVDTFGGEVRFVDDE